MKYAAARALVPALGATVTTWFIFSDEVAFALSSGTMLFFVVGLLGPADTAPLTGPRERIILVVERAMKNVLTSPRLRILGASVCFLLIGFAITLSVGLTVAVREGVSNEAWIAIATATYATFTFLTLVVLVAAAWYAWDQVESVKRSARLNMLDSLSAHWESDLLREARRLVNESGKERLAPDLDLYVIRNSKDLYTMGALANFFEEMGLMVKEGHLNLMDVVNRFRPSILYYGDLFSEHIESGQKENEDHLVNFKNLFAAMVFASSLKSS